VAAQARTHAECAACWYHRTSVLSMSTGMGRLGKRAATGSRPCRRGGKWNGSGIIPEAVAEIGRNQLEFLQGSAQILHDLQRDDIRIGQIRRFFQTLIAQPGDIRLTLSFAISSSYE